MPGRLVVARSQNPPGMNNAISGARTRGTNKGHGGGVIPRRKPGLEARSIRAHAAMSFLKDRVGPTDQGGPGWAGAARRETQERGIGGTYGGERTRSQRTSGEDLQKERRESLGPGGTSEANDASGDRKQTSHPEEHEEEEETEQKHGDAHQPGERPEAKLGTAAEAGPLEGPKAWENLGD
ncbi:hypothetical protein Esi_0096_0028 [Ectocarpus siliculosus]|uniref:Uncharacterized protein n=1 Tax=Ectocarpus siliculosus TaxID=2880 RepID=D7G952_ECTSI|nr:hypothetical protein Esi_0096_0028 [Ectocarpus siliculosus]|eukprot:CBJ28216.1 hypothetical protein Esi_0096_0028 [Ectocarpus siliculosus]